MSEPILYVFRKTGAQFELVKADEAEGKAVIKDEEGKLHLVSLSTLQKNYKKMVPMPGADKLEDLKSKPIADRKNIKGDPLNAKEDEVVLKAFTGMTIGVYPVVKKTKTSVSIKTKKGLMRFDAKTGQQIGASNPKFANRIELK